MRYLIRIIYIIVISASISVSAQDILITNARIYTLGEQGIIENGSILIRQGKIVEVGTQLQANSDVQVINADLQKFQQISNFQDLYPDYTYDPSYRVYDEPLAVVAAYIYEKIECTLAHQNLNCMTERKAKQQSALIEAFNAQPILSTIKSAKK